VEKQLRDWLAALPDRYKSYKKPANIWAMTTRRELAFCESYARECFSGRGIIVDLGCWFGATTYCFARGLTENARAKQNRRIEAFDRFVWDDIWQPVADAIGMPVKYRAGESFLREVQELLVPYRQIVHLHPGDLLDYQSSPEPIEMLFIDAMKTWPAAETIVQEFFPRLIPEVSIVVQQDFVYHAAGGAMNHLFMWRLRDYFEPIHFVPQSASLAFLCKKRLDSSAMPDLSLGSFTLEEINEAYDYSLLAVAEERGQLLIEAAKLAFLIARGFYQAALANAGRLVANNRKFSAQAISDTRAVLHARTVSENNKPAPTADCARNLENLAAIDSLLGQLAPPPTLAV
jgi:hypothetical protein